MSRAATLRVVRRAAASAAAVVGSVVCFGHACLANHASGRNRLVGDDMHHRASSPPRLTV